MEQKKPLTHIQWAQHYEAGRFREWIEIGRGRIEKDESGNTTAHAYSNRIPRGDNGYTCLLPIGVRPPDPAPQRPVSAEDEA